MAFTNTWRRRGTTYVAALAVTAAVMAVPEGTTEVASAVTSPVVAPPGGVSNGLLLWLDASNPNGDGTTPAAGAEITLWQDLSGTGNEATVNPNGVGGSNTGAYYEAAPTGFNGKPALRFTRQADARGSVYQTADLDIRAISRPDITVISVYRPTTKDGINGIWGADNLNWDRFFLSHIPAFGGNGLVALGPSSNGGETVPGAADTTVSHLMVVAYSGKIENGVNVGDPNASYVDYNCNRVKSFTDTTDATDAQTTMSVGWDGDTSAFDGYIAEMVVYERALTDAELASVNTYLATKYDLGSGCAAFATPPATVTAPSGSMTYGATPPALGSATALEDGTTTPALTFDTEPTCEVFESATAGNTIAGPPTPIVLSSTTPAGTYVVSCAGGSITGYSLDTYVDGVFTVLPATTTVTYTGATRLSSGSAALSATVVSPCAEGSTVEFTVTPNAVPAGPYTATVTGGVASTPTLTLTPGTVYSVGVSSAGDGNCNPDSDSATLTTTAPGVSTNGTGTYVVGATTLKYSHQVTSSVKTNTKARTRTTTYRGSVTWEVPGQTRLVGTVASTLLQSLDGTLTTGSAAWVTFPCPGPAPTPSSGGSSSPKPSGPVCGTFNGIGTLQSWNPALNKGRGGWSSTNGVSVAFEVTVFDAGSVCAPAPTPTSGSRKPVCKVTELPGDAFGILIGGTGPTDVVESGPTSISTGFIRSVA